MSKIKFILDYLTDLQMNNNREWYHANKTRYKEVHGMFLDEVQAIIDRLQPHDPSLLGLTAGEAAFRIYRDVRFSKDKTPYKTHFGAFMAQGGRKSSRGGYYIHVSNDDPFLAAGVYSPPKEALQAIRQEIVFRPEEINAIIAEKEKLGYSMYEEDKLKRGPKGFPDVGPFTELLKYKHILLSRNFDMKDLLAENFADNISEHFIQLVPLNNYLNTALDFTGNE
jgi:uncharacterized protein (TIGR02453 family)